jgi:hypothetical protein
MLVVATIRFGPDRLGVGEGSEDSPEPNGYSLNEYLEISKPEIAHECPIPAQTSIRKES